MDRVLYWLGKALQHDFHLKIDVCMDRKEIIVLIVPSVEQPRLWLCFCCYMHDWVGSVPPGKIILGLASVLMYAFKLKANPG